MTTEGWNKEQARKLSETRDLINSNARIVEALVNRRAKIAAEREQIFQVIAQQQAEIRVLQTENRRILDILERQKDN
ncbi:MAG: hypothetical protein F6K17_27645 [Okeania sp. SIO3C4]|nr:hypothetical protein [Okeania sp. SIO3B3]NER06093.1 hypothetical protein [Okeania sp. SIO3C4]